MASVASIISFDNTEVVIVKSSLTLLKLMPRPEGEPVSITVERPSWGDFKRIYKAATEYPSHWLTILWENKKGKPTFTTVNPYREIRSPKRQEILRALSPKPSDEEEPLHAVINIQEISKNEVAAKKTAGEGRKKRPNSSKAPVHVSMPAAFQEVVRELNLDNL